ncbi:MAG: LON peptidase substrate-binding domain-containing protein, partial [Armatimonadota bacterium]
MARTRRSLATSGATLGSLLDMEPMEVDGLRLPVIPIRDNVYLPNMNFTLLLGRDRSIRALEHALADGDRHVVLATQRDLEQEDPTFADIHGVGVMAEVISSGRLPDGTMRVALESLHRARILDWSRRDPYLEARVVRFDELDADRSDLEVDALCRTVATEFENLVGEGRSIPPEALVSVVGCREPGLLADTVVSYLSVAIERKQRMLEEVDVRRRLHLLVGALGDELRVLEIQREIRSRVEKEVGDNQRE